MNQQFKEVLEQITTDKTLQISKLFVLSRMEKDSFDIFQEVWPTVPDERRRDIVQELVEIAEVNFEVDFSPVFVLGMGDIHPEVRAKSVNGLWMEEDPALIGPFIHLLENDEVALVRAAAASTLGQYIYLLELEELDPQFEQPIKKALLDTIHLAGEDIEVRRRAVEAIAFFGGEDISQLIEAAYYDDNPKMQVSAVFAMGRNADKRWRPRVLAELENANSEIRFEAARACGELEINEAVPKLIMLIDEDADLQVQEISVWALGRIGGQLAREALEVCVESDNESIAAVAEDALDEINIFSGTLDLFALDDGEDFDFDDMDELDGYGKNYLLN